MTSHRLDRRPPSPCRARRRPFARAAAALVLLLGSAVAGACGRTTDIKAVFNNGLDTLTVYALSDTVEARRDYPTAIITGARGTNPDGKITARPIPVPVSASASFDVAFDIDASGKAVIYPLRRIVPGVGGRRVGLQVVAGTFESVTEAPARNYQYDSVSVTVEPGQVVAIQAQTSQCSLELSPYNYSKIVVDSVIPAIQAIYVRIASDPNCGFRSFLPGIPSR